MSSSDRIEALYPELLAAGGLANWLATALRKLPGELEPFAGRELRHYAQVRRGTRSSQVMIAAARRSFSVDFWQQGVLFGHGWFDDLESAAAAIHGFVGENSPLQTLAGRLPIQVSEDALAHAKGAEAFTAAASAGGC